MNIMDRMFQFTGIRSAGVDGRTMRTSSGGQRSKLPSILAQTEALLRRLASQMGTGAFVPDRREIPFEAVDQ